MKLEGIILIVDDRLEEKIGTFADCLINNGYKIQIAQTLEEADRTLKELLKGNKLDGIILDFSFPINSNDQSVHINGIPNGVSLFKKYQFKITTQRIPIIINTTGDEEYKKKYLGDIQNLGTPIYNVNHNANPLAQPNAEMVNDILGMLRHRTEQRNLSSTIQPESSWKRDGRTGYYNKTTQKYTYLRNGD